MRANLSYRHSLFPDDIYLGIEVTSDCLCCLESALYTVDRQRKQFSSVPSLRRFPGEHKHADDPTLQNQRQMAKSVVQLLHEDSQVDNQPSERSPVARISAGDAFDLIVELDRAVGKYLHPAMAVDLKILRNLYVNILDDERAQVSRNTPHIKHRVIMQRLSPKWNCLPEPLCRPSSIKLNSRNAIELERDTYDFGPVLGDLINQDSHRGFKCTSLQSRPHSPLGWHPNKDVSTPLLRTQKGPSKATSTDGYGILEQDGPWKRDSKCHNMSTRVTREFGGQYDVETWRQDQLREVPEFETERDPAKVIWEKMRINIGGSGFSDEDEERLQELNMMSAPWL